MEQGDLMTITAIEKMENTFGRIEYCTSKILSMASQALEVDTFEEQQLINELTDAFETLRKRLLSLVFNEADPRRIEICIQHLQRQLLYLADKLDHAYQNQHSTTTLCRQHQTLITTASQKIEQVLALLEENFSRYLNMEELVSPDYRVRFRQELQTYLLELQPLLHRLHLKKSFIEILNTAASTVSEENIAQHLTYHAAGFLKRMYRDLLILAKGLSPKYATERINQLLVSINFNAPFFVNYLTGTAGERLLKAGGDQEKSAILYSYQKTFAQYIQTIAKPYVLTLPGARDWLLNWVQTELNSLGKCQTEKPPTTIFQPDQELNVTFNSNLTVKQLAALCKLLYSRGILHHENQQKIFQTMARLFKTKGAEEISAGSINKNYYAVNAPTAQSLKTILLEMANDTRNLVK